MKRVGFESDIIYYGSQDRDPYQNSWDPERWDKHICEYTSDVVSGFSEKRLLYKENFLHNGHIFVG